MREEITPLILTFNEAPNIRRTLEALHWAKEILILDSFSSDETLEIAGTFANVRVLQRKFDTFAGQCNFGLQHILSPWVLSLDADYVLTESINREITSLELGGEVMGFQASFTYCIFGHPLRASLYPPRTVLYRRNAAKYVEEGHAHRVKITGLVNTLHGRILHDDRKPLGRWLSEQWKYMELESASLASADHARLKFQDRLRKLGWPAPLAVFLYCLFVKGLVLDGWPGWYYTLQRVLAETLLALRMTERKLPESDD